MANDVVSVRLGLEIRLSCLKGALFPLYWKILNNFIGVILEKGLDSRLTPSLYLNRGIIGLARSFSSLGQFSLGVFQSFSVFNILFIIQSGLYMAYIIASIEKHMLYILQEVF